MTRYPLFAVAALVMLAPVLAAQSRRPNVVIILADDLGYGDTACYGHPAIRTPNLDRVAAQGIRFTSFYSASPVCSPSRVGLLTGRNPNRAGVYDWIIENGERPAPQARHLVHLRQSEVTLPKLLKQAGYATFLAGKWHCNTLFNSDAQPRPRDLGFDYWFATQNNAAPSHENPDNYVRNGTAVGKLEGFSCQLAAQEAIAWMEDRSKRNAAEPFFVYLAFHEPHEPVASPRALVDQYLPKARNENEAQYFANVENLDAAVGKVLAALDRLKLADDTLVVFSSDNGPETLNRHRGAYRSYGRPGPLRGMKLWTTEAGFRVPGIMRWPGRIKAGQVSDEPVCSLDLLPTITALAGARVPAGLELDGADMRAAWSGRTVARSRPLFWVFYNALNEQVVAMREGAWKILACLDGGSVPKMTNITESSAPRVRQAKLTDFSLYDLSTDIGEARDVSAAEPERLRDLSAKLERLYREMTRTMYVWPDATEPSRDR
jgi:arylsulfatase A